jgi:hypothetical protein
MPYYAGDYYAGDGTLSQLAAAGSRALARVLPAAKKLLPFAGAAAAGAAATEVIAGGGEERPRYRRMNVLNARALRRSMRRVQGFAKFARKTMTFTTRHKLKKRRR